jgi:hypothetical protein
MFLLIGVHLMGSIAGELSKLGDVLIHQHGSLFQILKLLLQLDHTLRNMVCMESSTKLRPVDTLGFLMGFHVGISQINYKS